MDDSEVDLKLLFGDIEEDFRSNDTNIVPLPTLIHQREIGRRFTHTTAQHFEKWREDSFVEREHTHIACQIPPSASEKATFLLAFSPDGTKVASSHLDHNIYVTDVRNGKCICTLKGHPRSPWCVAFHPSSNEIVASGCLGGEVRVWDLKGGSEVWTPDKKSVIASLAFHPTDQVLVIATENDLYFWDWFYREPFAKISTACKLEKIKYVEFDPLGYKLITGIRIGHSDRHQMENCHGNHTTNNNNNNNSDLFMGGSLPTNPRNSSPRLSTRFFDRLRNRNLPNQTSSPLDGSSQSEPPPAGLLTSSQRDALSNARQFAESESLGVERLGNGNTGTGLAPGPSSFSDLRFPSEGSSTLSPPRRRLLPRHILFPEEDLPRPLLGPDFRPLARPPPAPSDDSASSSSIDSGSSVTSGLSGASHERNTRLSLLWTSRLTRPGGNESDTSAGGGYDLEERRGEGSVMRGSAPPVPPRGGQTGLEPPRVGQTGLETTPAPTPLDDRNTDDSARERDRESHRERHPTERPDSRSFWSASRGLSRRRLLPTRRIDEEDEDSDGDSGQRSRHGGQGGRWMYYRGKIPPVASRSRSSGRNDTGAAGTSGVTSRSSFDTRSPSRGSPSRGVGTLRPPIDDPLAIPGPSGIAGDSILPNLASSDLFAQNSSFGRGQNQSSLLDPQFGVQLLSRHIENMQSICRLLFIPRAQLELTRHRNDISQLQQIRSMLYDIQHQIRSLQRASAEQTVTDEVLVPPGDSGQTLNSAAVEPEPLGAELLNSGSRGLFDEVEVEVNIGTENVDNNYSFSTLAEEDPEQLNSSFAPSHLEASDNVPSSLEPVPEIEPSSRTGSTAFRISNRAARNSSRALRNLVAASLRSRRTVRFARNRLVWTGLLRRWSTLRRSSRTRLNSILPGGDASRRGKRRRALLNRSLAEGRSNGSVPGTSNSSSAYNSEAGPLFPAYSTPGQENEEPLTPPSVAPRARRLSFAEWQRRLRSLTEGPRRRGSTSRESEGRPPNTNNEPPRRAPSNAGSLRDTHGARMTSRRHVSNNSDDDRPLTPEREPRAGPPTTSLSSRIATMVAQQLLRENNEGTGTTETSTAAPGPSRLHIGTTGRLRQRHFTQNRQSLVERNPRSPFRAMSYANGASPYSLPPLPAPFDDLPPGPPVGGEDLDTGSGDISQPVYQSLRNLRREIMLSHRNRMLRRSSSNLVSGRDLAGATLAAINPVMATEQNRQRENFQQDRRESYRHMLQLMADRLNQMMNQSLSVGGTSRREGSGGTGNPFDLQDVPEEPEIPGGSGATPQNNRRRPANLRTSARRPFMANIIGDEFEPGPASALDRHMQSSLFDPYSSGLYNNDNSFYRIQAWDFTHFDIPDISDGFSNIVVPKCRIHFDASVSISVDGTLLAAVLPDTQTLTQIGVYSLEPKTLGQLLYSSSIGFNIVCVSFSPTMRHLVVGIPSRRLGVHHNEKQVIGKIYKLCQNSSSSYRLGLSGYLKPCKAIKLESELRQSSVNCIRWIPKAGMGLVYGTNKGQLTVIR